MHRYFIKLAYNGNRYNGWQVQDNTANTVQEIIQNSLSSLLQEKTEITGCGRTDTGVHATEFYAHFDSEKNDLHSDPKHWLYKLNKMLPPDIAIHEFIPVNQNTHARFDAISRKYIYKISRNKNPFFQDSHWYLYGDLDLDNIQKACSFLIGEKDFSCFSKSNTQTKTNICNITEAYWETNKEEWIFHIRANRFLRNMVRAIVGTLIEVGKNNMKPEEIIDLLNGKNRSDAGFSVPAKGLYLTEVKYKKDIF